MTAHLKPVADVADADASPYELPSPEHRPCFIVLDEWTEARGPARKMRPGVWHCSMARGTNGEPPAAVETWIAGPVHLDAQTHDEAGDNHGRLLRFQTSAGRWRTWAMPQEVLAGSGEELRAALLNMGLEIDPDRKGLFNRYLASRTPKRVVRCVTSTGWAAPDAFVLPDGVIGPAAASVVYQSGDRSGEGHGAQGTLEEWQEHVAALATDNPCMLVALSAAFVGPLLHRVNVEGGGLHFFGYSSIGKTTLLEGARSVWGGPDFRRQWRATANGLEGVAALHNDLLLPLDEISECDGRALGEVAYMLANGVGKSRASRSGAARPAKRWRTSVLSTGETTLAAHMLKAGQRPNAGQGVRLLDLPAGRRFGLFDDLHGHASGRALADGIKRATGSYYGSAGRAFLERLTHDDRDLGGLLEEAKALDLFDADAGQEARAAIRFSLIGLAGELATEYGVTGWPAGAAMAAAGEAFQAWRDHRGRGQDEPTKIVEAVADFIDRHGEARFEPIHSDGYPPIRDRAGWREGSTYFFTSCGFREAVTGFDNKVAAAVLIEKGVLPPPGPDQKTARARTIKGHKKTRVYVIDAERLADCTDGR